MEAKQQVSPLADLAPNLQPIKKVMVIISKNTLESVYAGFVLANGARMEGKEAEIFFTFFGLEAVNKKTVDNLHVAAGNPEMEAAYTAMIKSRMEKMDVPPVKEFLEILSASGCRLWACKLAMEMFDFTIDDLVPEIENVLTVGEFYARAAGDATQIIFI